MKLTNKITDLLFDLSGIESPANAQFLIGDGAVLRNNLLKLYRATDNIASHELIIKIMGEAGYSWFGKLANSAKQCMFDKALSSAGLSLTDYFVADNEEHSLSENEFLELVPANGYFH